MIWAALSIGVTVLLAIWTVRPRPDGSLVSPARWLVLPDEPALPDVIEARPALPAVAVTYPSWRAMDRSGRAEKPMHPWFRSYAPYAAVAVFGAMSLDLTGLGLGVPEIMPTHMPVHHEQPHNAPDVAGLQRLADADLSGLTSAWFDATPDGVFDTSAIAPSSHGLQEFHHDWWA